MWVFDQHVIRPSIAPFESQSPLVINSYMPSAVILFEVSPRRYPHEIDRWRGIQLTVNTLDQEMSSTEVIRDELRALIARDRAVETWLTNQVRARLAAEHAKAQ